MSGIADKHLIQERAYVLLKAMITDGRLAPGQTLLEAQVAKAFGISRSPARHALKTLNAEKLIREAQGRGYEVIGKGKATLLSGRAVLDEVTIPAVAQWERIYAPLEQELCSRIIFSSVRIVEERLAEHFGVSRTVARDVLARMHSVGIISKDSLGRWIASRVTPEKTHHLYELRWLLEPQALLQASPHVPIEYLEKARLSVMEALDGFPREGFDTDVVETDLHITLLSHCPNQEIVSALARTRVLFVPTRYLFDPILKIPLALIADALEEHLAIYDLLLAKKTSDAAETLFQHLKHADDRWLQRFEGASKLTQPELPGYLLPA